MDYDQLGVSAAGSTSSITRRSLSVRSPLASMVLGDDEVTVPPWGIEALGSAYYANRAATRYERRSQLGSGRADVSIRARTH